MRENNDGWIFNGLLGVNIFTLFWSIVIMLGEYLLF